MHPAEADLIPVRALNQVTYCPRLYYLEYVEGVMPTNEHVEDGVFQHRRVNDPNLSNRTRKDGEVRNTRSVQLDSPSLGITAKLDLIEERDGSIRPIEFKRSKAPPATDGRPGYYENDAIQVCAQGMLLEQELGRPIASGVLYYIGSKARVDVPLDGPLRARTYESILYIRELDAKTTPPEPLPAELRQRCFGCSLATICLPEETLFLAGVAEEPADEPPVTAPSGLTRVIPGRDDGAVLYLQEPGSHVGVRGQHLVVRKDGRELNRVPLPSIRQVVVLGNVQVSTQALSCLATNETPVAYLTGHGRFVAALQPAPAKNMNLRVEQYRRFADPARALELARAVVRAKVANQRTLLMRSLRSRAGDGPEEAPPRGSAEPAARDMAELLPKIDKAPDLSSLLGLEGQAAALYFAQFGRMLKGAGPGRPFDFRTRNRRPPRDPVNALLSFAYALLCKDCFAAACTVGLDPYCGFYHTGRHGRPSLALDLMEEFRAVVADSVVLGLINNGSVTSADFLTWGESCHLTDTGRRAFFETYERRKATEVTHPTFGYTMSYGRMLEVQARMLAAVLRGDIPRYVGFSVR